MGYLTRRCTDLHTGVPTLMGYLTHRPPSSTLMGTMGTHRLLWVWASYTHTCGVPLFILGSTPYTDPDGYYGHTPTLMGLGPIYAYMWVTSLHFSLTFLIVLIIWPSSFSLSIWLRSRSPLAHFELIYIYISAYRRLHISKGDLDQYVQILYQMIAP